MSDERRRELARLAGNGDLDAYSQLGLLLQREGQDVTGAFAAFLGFTSNHAEAFRALRNNPLVKGTVDLVNRERARWTGEQLRAIAETRTLTDRTRDDLRALASRIERQRYPEFFEEWAAINGAIRGAVPTRGVPIFNAVVNDLNALDQALARLASGRGIPLSSRNPSQDPSADLQNRSEPTASPSSPSPSPEDLRAP